jgi:RNA polymerase sigma-70 factor (ECF subfamily)
MTPQRARISEWMDRASTGDDEAFSSIASAVQDDLYRFALGQGANSADAAEAVQETLLRAYRGRDKWKKGWDALSWLYGMTMNVVRELRRQWRRAGAYGLDLDGVQARQAPAVEPPLDPAEMTALVAAIESLPDRQREAVTLRFLQEMSVKDTAEAMGCAEGTVKAAVFAALGNLRKVLKTDERR